jgi:dihydrofolate reductase
MRLTSMTQITLDGVFQANGGASEEDRANGFVRGGWAHLPEDGGTDERIDAFYRRADAFLFGRRTYELFASSWGTLTEQQMPGWEGTHRALATRPKHIASASLSDPTWAGSTVLRGDLETAIRDLKAQPGGELQVHGSGTLLRWLLARHLVDELTLVTVPVILGQGARLFPQDGPDQALELLDAFVDPANGVTVQRFRPVDRPTHLAD